jgi:serine/threonine protein kinase
MRAKDSVSAGKEIRAIQSLQKLEHPYLVRIFQVWSIPGYIVICMELADGSLLDLLKAYDQEYQSGVSPEHICLFLGQAADAIDFLNARTHMHEGRLVGYQHLDIKPNNILLFGEVAKLADFGLAAVQSQPYSQRKPVGTVEFAATEIFDGKVTDFSDQYSLAVTYCLLRGRYLPFSNTPKTFSSTPRSIRGSFLRPEADLSMLTDAEKPIIARALSPTPSNRWPNCVTMMKALTKTFDLPSPPAGPGNHGRSNADEPGPH